MQTTSPLQSGEETVQKTKTRVSGKKAKTSGQQQTSPMVGNPYCVRQTSHKHPVGPIAGHAGIKVIPLTGYSSLPRRHHTNTMVYTAELQTALRKMPKGRAPGPDSLNSCPQIIRIIRPFRGSAAARFNECLLTGRKSTRGHGKRLLWFLSLKAKEMTRMQQIIGRSLYSTPCIKSNVGPSLVGASSLKSIWPNYSGPPDCLRGPR